MANENVRNTAVSSISDASSAISNSTGRKRKRYGLFSFRRDDGTTSSIHRSHDDYYKYTYLAPGYGRTTWFSTSRPAKTRDGRVINDLYVTAPWSRAARSTGRKVTSSEYPFYHGRYLMRDYDSTAWRYDPSRVKLKDGRVINELQPVKPWGKLARSTGRKVPKKK